MMTYAEYDAIEAVRWSSLKHLVIDGSPLHYRHHRDHGDGGDNSGRAKGRAMHALLLEPQTFSEHFAIFEGARRAGAEWVAFASEASGAGKSILKADEAQLVVAQAAAIRAHPAARELLAACTLHEHTITWADPETGIRCKARLDAVSPDFTRMLDLKGMPRFGRDGRMAERVALKLGHVHQLAFYRRGVRAVHSEEAACSLIGVETAAPHDVGVWHLMMPLLDHADREISEGLRTLVRCIDTDTWPGHHAGAYDFHAPDWILDPERAESDEEEDSDE